MRHLKRQVVPKNWPLPRKGTAFVAKPSSEGIPLLIALRNMLQIAQNRKEVKRALHEKAILLNNKEAKDDKIGVNLFDTVALKPSKKFYRMTLGENGKFMLEEIKESEINNKVAKVVDKKTLKGKKVQLNLSDGRNFISNVKCNTNDSVVINFKDKKIDECLPLKEKMNAIVFAGKHTGKTGVIEKLKTERKMASLKIGNEKINVLIKQMMVTR